MLRDVNEVFARSLRQAHRVAADINDIATTSLLETWIDEAEKRVWFLNATLQQHP